MLFQLSNAFACDVAEASTLRLRESLQFGAFCGCETYTHLIGESFRHDDPPSDVVLANAMHSDSMERTQPVVHSGER
jgi:hypothetical protein